MAHDRDQWPAPVNSNEPSGFMDRILLTSYATTSFSRSTQLRDG